MSEKTTVKDKEAKKTAEKETGKVKAKAKEKKADNDKKTEAEIDGKEAIKEASTVKGKYLMYKDRPLVRENNVICYGNMEDEYILSLTVMTETEQDGHTVPDMILIQILKTDTSLPSHEKIAKQEIKQGLYEAFELGLIWLERLIGE